MEKVYTFPMAKVLLVDDEPRILLLLQSLLKTNKYEVERGVSIACRLDFVLVRFQQTLEQQENPRLVID